MDWRFMSGLDNRMERKAELESGGNIFEQEEKKKQRDYAAIDARNAIQQDFQNKRTLQDDFLTGNLNIQKEKSAGLLARQRLIEGTAQAKNTNDFNLGVYNAESTGNINRFDAQTNRIKALTPEAAKGDSAAYGEFIKGIMGDPSLNITQKIEYINAFGGRGQAAAPQAKPQAVGGNAMEPNPGNRTQYFKPDPAAPTAGAQSMTFATDMGTASSNAKKKRGEIIDSYNRFRLPGTRPFSGA